MSFEYFHAVDAGRSRSNNEDSVEVDPVNALAVLADGMGGYNAGEVASTMATSFIKTELGRWLHEAAGHATDTEVRRAMDICVDNANRAIFNAANSNPQRLHPAHTLLEHRHLALSIRLIDPICLRIRKEDIPRFIPRRTNNLSITPTHLPPRLVR